MMATATDDSVSARLRCLVGIKAGSYFHPMEVTQVRESSSPIRRLLHISRRNCSRPKAPVIIVGPMRLMPRTRRRNPWRSESLFRSSTELKIRIPQAVMPMSSSSRSLETMVSVSGALRPKRRGCLFVAQRTDCRSRVEVPQSGSYSHRSTVTTRERNCLLTSLKEEEAGVARRRICFPDEHGVTSFT